MRSLILATLLTAASLLPGFAAEQWDTVVRNGVIIDGAGGAGFKADLAIKDGRITRIGAIEGSAAKVIDASGLVVAPGFIDVHTHAENIFSAPLAANFLRMGVTTVIIGNCGASETNVATLFHALERTTVSINIATLIGHNAIRTEVMGSSPQPPNGDQLTEMQRRVEQAMKDGAVGFSTGLIYAPGKFSQTAEIIELAKIAAKYDGVYTTHLRDENEGLPGSLDEAFQIGRAANLPVEISHLTVAGNLIHPQKIPTIQFMDRARNEGLLTNVIAALDKARQSGLKVSQDLYAYSAISALPTRLLPSETLEGGPDQFQHRLKDPAEHVTLASKTKEKLLASGRENFSHVVIVTSRRFKSLQSLTIPQAARQRSGSDSLDAQIELILDLAATTDTTLIIYEQSDENLLPLMALPNTMFISDSGAFATGAESQHPRGYGSAARILARYVREQHVLSMEEAIRKMTSLGATTFHLKDRGEIRSGAWADLVIFDAARVQDHSTYASPHVPATGFKSVLVNGVETIANDKHTGARAGRPIRRGE
jgi:N-acyl-D-amino-acid deacylase